MVTAGTSDIPVAEEALVTAQMMGHHAEAIYDVGVAGLHRLLEHQKKIGGGARDYLRGGNGRSAAERRCGFGGGAGDCCADQYGLRVEFWRVDGVAGDAQQLRFECERGEY